MIAKPVRSGYVELDGVPHAIFTSQVLEEHLAVAADINLSPVIYQPLLAKRFDVRATIVGDQIFAAEIDSQSDPAAIVDWRQTANPMLPHRRAVLPDCVAQATLRLMRQFGLAFGAVDFVLTNDGEYVFLEINPNGQWLWLDDQLDLGITAHIAQWLAGAD